MNADTADAGLHRPWAGKDKPSLEPLPTDTFERDIPGYDLRSIMMARNPLAVVNAFFVQIRVILASVLGIGMCPFGPHCRNNPCQDAFGSVAELLGGCAGRADALVGAAKCQKPNGSLHYHFLHSFNACMSLALYKKLQYFWRKVFGIPTT